MRITYIDDATLEVAREVAKSSGCSLETALAEQEELFGTIINRDYDVNEVELEEELSESTSAYDWYDMAGGGE